MFFGSSVVTWEDGTHGGEGVDLEGVHLPLGTEANHFHTHQQEAHSQETDVHELTDDWQPEDAWKQQWEKKQSREKKSFNCVCYGKRIRSRLQNLWSEADVNYT